jgi:hypothetical protein
MALHSHPSPKKGDTIAYFLASVRSKRSLFLVSILALLLAELIIAAVVGSLHHDETAPTEMNEGESSSPEIPVLDITPARNVIEALQAVADRPGDEASEHAIAFVRHAQNLDSANKAIGRLTRNRQPAETVNRRK